MRDFSHEVYGSLLDRLKCLDFEFYTFEDLTNVKPLKNPHVILRHDVDRLPSRSKMLADLEYRKGARSTYFFRTKSISFDTESIRAIKVQGHEIGYHYETLSDAKGDYDQAWSLFKQELSRFDSFGGVKSIAMHGRPFSKWDNRDLWDRFDYRDAGISIEAYRDIDWEEYLYFTDTGRSWANEANIRDHVTGAAELNQLQPSHTCELMELIDGKSNLVISTHPERWSPSFIGWLQVLLTDTFTNQAKLLVKKMLPCSN